MDDLLQRVRRCEALQQPEWGDPSRLRDVQAYLRGSPALIRAGDILALRATLARVARGEALVVHRLPDPRPVRYGLIPFPPMHRSRARPRLRSRRSLAVLLPILLLAAAGFTILTTEFVIVGLLPALAADLQVSVAQAGLLVSLFAFSVAAFGPFLTAALAGVERKRLFVACLLLFAAANALAAVAGDIWTMAVARFVPALALPVFWAMASETAAHLAGPSREGRAVALVFFGIVAATVLGIPIGTLIDRKSVV